MVDVVGARRRTAAVWMARCTRWRIAAACGCCACRMVTWLVASVSSAPASPVSFVGTTIDGGYCGVGTGSSLRGFFFGGRPAAWSSEGSAVVVDDAALLAVARPPACPEGLGVATGGGCGRSMLATTCVSCDACETNEAEREGQCGARGLW